jgi:hypothetical protein
MTEAVGAATRVSGINGRTTREQRNSWRRPAVVPPIVPSTGFVLFRSPLLLKAQDLSLLRLWPCEVMGCHNLGQNCSQQCCSAALPRHQYREQNFRQWCCY